MPISTARVVRGAADRLGSRSRSTARQPVGVDRAAARRRARHRSHLDSVRRGGAYDGALGVVPGSSRRTRWRKRGVETPVASCRSSTRRAGAGDGRARQPPADGALDPAAVLDRPTRRHHDPRRVAAAGVDPGGLGPDPAALARIRAYVEVHVEQGRALEDLERPLAVATAICPTAAGASTCAARRTTADDALAHRRDPMPALAALIAAGRSAALRAKHW